MPVRTELNPGQIQLNNSGTKGQKTQKQSLNKKNDHQIITDKIFWYIFREQIYKKCISFLSTAKYSALG